ncbi:hypothetical protein ACP70R_018792 [Stipagrostis hirtigluma subsp. patula]
MEACANGVRIVSRRMVRPSLPATAQGGHPPMGEVQEIHLTPWDLRFLTADYSQKGILLPKPPERGDGTVTVSLRCTGEGAEFVHAMAPRVAVADIVASIYTPAVVWSFYSLNQVLGADAAMESLPVLSVQVTELADGVFIGMSMNHSVGDGATFWNFFNTWSEINRRIGISDDLHELSTPAPVYPRWFLETCPVPIPMPFSKVQHLVRRFERPMVQECFFIFSTASVQNLKAKANDEMAGTATATISSLQAVLAHLWRAVCRARRLPPEQDTFYHVIVGCRGRVNSISATYIGNAVVRSTAESTAGEVERNGLGWTAWLLNRAVASFNEARMRDFLDGWVQEPVFMSRYLSPVSADILTGSSPRFDVFGNDFGWGKPLAVRSGLGKNTDGTATVFEGPEKDGSISLEVCLVPETLARLVADEEFMEAVS